MEEKQIYTTDNYVSCDGTNTDAGHPKIYLDIKLDKNVVCPYCSRQFIFTGDQ